MAHINENEMSELQVDSGGKIKGQASMDMVGNTGKTTC